MAEHDTPPPTITAIKIPVIKKENQASPFAPPPHKTAKQLAARRNQERVKSILLLAIPDEYLLKFHNVSDAKSLWEAIKARFGGNEESKKMHKNVLKHQFENFTTSPSESLDKAYDRFQKLINIDNVDIDDLYNNLRVYEDEMKKSSSSSSTSQNLAFLSSENTNSTNKVTTANEEFRVKKSDNNNQVSSVHDTTCSFLAQPTSNTQLENDDFKQIDGDDLEELDIRWHMAMITGRPHKFMQRTGRNIDFKERRPVSLDKSKVYKASSNKSSTQALVAQDGQGGYDWSDDFDIEPVNYALMVISSSGSSSSSDKQVNNCSKQCIESFKSLLKNFNDERAKLSKAKLEIQGYELALESLESRILGHERNELAWGEKYEFQNYELKCREIKIDSLTLELEKVSKERDDLKKKTEAWEASSKHLNSSSETQTNEVSSSSETDSEISVSVFDVRSSDEDNTSKNDRFANNEFHAVPPPITGNYLTPRADISFAGLDELAIRKKIIATNKATCKFNVDKPKTGLVHIANPASTARPKVSTARPSVSIARPNGNPKILLQDHAVVDSGCSCHMTGNKAYLSEYEDYNGGFMAFRSDPKGGRITGRGKIKTTNLDFNDVYFVDELKFNLFSVSQMCDKKNSILFTKNECLILSPSFKLPDESQVVLRAPRKDDVYNLDLKNIVPSGGITCLYANATSDESKLWHMRLGHENFKNINKLVKGNLVRGLPSKVFINDHTCVACKKGKQHKASCKAKLERTIRKPLELLHMDLFGPVSVDSINKKRYCLVITDDFSRFSWVFFLAIKDETSEILCNFIIGLENQLNHSVKIIRCDNGTKFKNQIVNKLCAKKGIKREFSVARTPQQNGVAERKNEPLLRLLELLTKPQNKTPYELLIVKPHIISFMRPFGCPLNILNTLDSLGKFDGKSDEGYLLGYSTRSKAFRVYNKRTKRVEENLHIDFLVDQPNVVGKGPDWIFDLDFLTNTMNYIPVHQERIKKFLRSDASEKPSEEKNVQDSEDDAEQVLQDERQQMITQEKVAKAVNNAARQEFEEDKRNNVSSNEAVQATNSLSTDRPNIGTANTADADSNILSSKGIFSRAYDDTDVGAEADLNHMDTTIVVSPIPTLRIHQEEPKNITQALHDESWVEAMQEELLQFKLQKVWVLVDMPHGKKVIGTKWVFRNKRDGRSIVVKNKARLMAQGFREEEGIDYDKVFAHVARIEAIKLFLAFASYMSFTVYQMDVKSAFLYGIIGEEVYVHQPPGFVDPAHPNKVYKVIKALYGLHQASRA
ncbi:putative ribonuclease H-like domain-containing protein [Tanacetum coccineum]